MLKVAEKFVSINGEAQKAGELAVFIRLKGCNLKCPYCDTKWANEADAECEELSAEELTEYAVQTGVKNVTLTGGEPLLHKEAKELIKRLSQKGLDVEIETNGSIDISEYAAMEKPPSFTFDYKLPSSGQEEYMLTSNYKYLSFKDTVKFVCADVNDLKVAKRVTEEFKLTEKCRVYLSPVFGEIDPADMVGFMIDNKMNGVRLQLQLHKFIWSPDVKGV